MKTYLFVFNPGTVSREAIVHHLDASASIENWYAFFGNTICIATELDNGELTRLIRKAFPDLNFVVTDVRPEQISGWMPKPVWSFFDDPHPADAEAA